MPLITSISMSVYAYLAWIYHLWWLWSFFILKTCILLFNELKRVKSLHAGVCLDKLCVYNVCMMENDISWHKSFLLLFSARVQTLFRFGTTIWSMNQSSMETFIFNILEEQVVVVLVCECERGTRELCGNHLNLNLVDKNKTLIIFHSFWNVGFWIWTISKPDVLPRIIINCSICFWRLSFFGGKWATFSKTTSVFEFFSKKCSKMKLNYSEIVFPSNTEL